MRPSLLASLLVSAALIVGAPSTASARGLFGNGSSSSSNRPSIASASASASASSSVGGRSTTSGSMFGGQRTGREGSFGIGPVRVFAGAKQVSVKDTRTMRTVTSTRSFGVGYVPRVATNGTATVKGPVKTFKSEVKYYGGTKAAPKSNIGR